FYFSSRRRHTRWPRDWSSDVCSSDLERGCLVVHLFRPVLPLTARLFQRGAPVLPNPRALRLELILHPLQLFCAPNFAFLSADLRSEERRVGKESRSQLRTDYQNHTCE